MIFETNMKISVTLSFQPSFHFVKISEGSIMVIRKRQNKNKQHDKLFLMKLSSFD